MENNKIIRAIIIGLAIVFSGISHSFAALNYQQAYQSYEGKYKVLIVVNSSIYAAISSSLKSYLADLKAENYKVTLIKYISGTAQELKDYIKSLSGLKGAVFVGDLPVAKFEIKNDFGDFGYANFPADLFYMDLDGQWQDKDNNGIYDTHTVAPDSKATLGPEIWLGRLTASSLYNPDLDEAGLLKNYFEKLHAYRTDKLKIRHRALSFVDDDWYTWGSCYLKDAYDDVTTVNDINLTTTANYKLKLTENYEWINICVHSSETNHTFKENNGQRWGFIDSNDILDINPKTVFYNLFACSSAKYTAPNYIGGQYIFSKTNGLAAVGTTKLGGMLNFNKFYFHLGDDERNSLGTAYRSWFRAMNLNDFDLKCWFYGMTLLGDPTLSLDPPIAVINNISSYTISYGQKISFSGSGKIHHGSIETYSWRSSKNGFLSDDAAFTTKNLSVGTHTIYLKVRDNKDRWSTEAKSAVITVK